MAKQKTKPQKPKATKPKESESKEVEERDEMLLGYWWALPQYETQRRNGKTPYDYMPDDKGILPGEQKKPFGKRKVDMENGIKEWMTIPPVAIWDLGMYFSDLPPDLQKELGPPNGIVREGETFYAWIVPGIGTPGNYEYNIYLLPESEAQTPTGPDHPFFWDEKVKKEGDKRTSHVKKTTWGSGSGSGSGTSYSGYGTTNYGGAASTQKATGPSLPASTRLRCTGCGHWFKEMDIAPHAKSCCPGSENWDGSSDWAFMCATECGCNTLDEVSVCKPGYPRKPNLGEQKDEAAAEAAADESGVTSHTEEGVTA